MKRMMAAALAVTSIISFMSCKKAEKGDGKVLNIYVWNDEFVSRFNDYCTSIIPEDVKVNFIQTPNENNEYQDKLDQVLLTQDSPSFNPDDRVDIFLVESDYALKYASSSYTLDVKKDIGLTEQDLANQFKYTKDLMTDSKGSLKGVTWQATPGGFIYRRSYARDVLGTDDPELVQQALSDWNKFDLVAGMAKEKGYCMVSGYADTFRIFYDNINSKLVDGNKINIDPMINKWIEQTKLYTELGYNARTKLWDQKWNSGMLKDGKVFGYFGPAWFIDFSMPRGEGSAAGDWAYCKGPQTFSWGGSWICGVRGTDNIDLVKDIMYTLTCDKDTMFKIATKYGDFTNNAVAMREIAESDYKNPFLGGQNHLALFIDSAAAINKDNVSKYDQAITENLQNAMADYFDGKVDLNKAWNNFYASVMEVYPNLIK